MSTHAVLEWREGLPYSADFEDVYFSASPENPQHGLAETCHVFLQHNRLLPRWQALPTAQPSHFIIIETGFGSGLNFLAALRLWRQTAPAEARLHFVSVEIAPFRAEDMQRAHAHFPELAEYSQALLLQYRLLQPGINHLELTAYGVSLTLYIGDAANYLPQLNLHADAWFLDGFAPSKNPQMWQPFLFEAMARCAQPGTTFATFTSAGVVRRGLQAAGFQVEKTPGYGAKREMIFGIWSRPPAVEKGLASLPRVAVIGAGIAGCSTAWFLAQLGCQVHIFERSASVASGASGNPRGMLYPRLNAEKPLNDQLALHSYSFSLRHYANLHLNAHEFEACGVLQLGGSPREHKRVHKVSARYHGLDLFKQVSPAEASAIAGVEIAYDSLYFSDGAWVNPVAACERMLAHPQIHLHLQHTVSQLCKQDSDSSWQLGMAAPSQFNDTFDAVIICTATDANDLLPKSGMILHPVRGQMGMIAGQPAMQPLRTILCGDGYLTPQHQGVHTMGATFAPGQTDCTLRSEDNLANLNMLTSLSPDFGTATAAMVTFARASLRCASPDYLPYVGPVLPMKSLEAQQIDPVGCHSLPAGIGVYAHVAHGSKGLLTAPYCAALLARRIMQDAGFALPTLTEDSFRDGLHPQRHIFKQLGWKHMLSTFNTQEHV